MDSDKRSVRVSLHTKVDKDLLLKTKIRCLQEGVALNKVIEQLLRQWLEEKKS